MNYWKKNMLQTRNILSAIRHEVSEVQRTKEIDVVIQSTGRIYPKLPKMPPSNSLGCWKLESTTIRTETKQKDTQVSPMNETKEIN